MRQIRIFTNSDLRNLLWLLLLLSGVFISHVNDVYLRILSHRRFIFQVIMLWKKTKVVLQLEESDLRLFMETVLHLLNEN